MKTETLPSNFWCLFSSIEKKRLFENRIIIFEVLKGLEVCF